LADNAVKKQSNPSEARDVTKLTISDLLRRMTTSQLWTCVGAGVSVVVASFLFGFAVSSWLQQASLSQSASKVATLEQQQADLKRLHEQLKTKEEFLRVYYLYSRAQWNIDYLQSHIQQCWKGLDFQIGLQEAESPARDARKMSGDKFPPKEDLRAMYARYKNLASQRPNVNMAGVQYALEHFGPAIDSLDKAQADRNRYRAGLKTLLEQHHSREGYEVKFGKFAKGVTDVGVIKFAYDGAEVPLPNEFFPEPAW
jgi:hypothetical protein